MKLYSEYGEDAWILENLPLPDYGFFLDVGCAHPVDHNNTAFLRARGWDGWAVDGNIHWKKIWAEHGYSHMFVNKVISDTCKPVKFDSALNIESRIAGTGTDVAAVTLENILPDIGPEIDFMSLDLEGGEYDALMGLSEAAWPGIIVSEHTSRSQGFDHRVRDLLCGNGYALVHATVANHIFYKWKDGHFERSIS